MSMMLDEARAAPDAVARLLDENRAVIARIVARLVAQPPAFVVTCARGSSDHAATYAKYLIETMIGIPVASAAPSVVSVLARPVTAPAALCIAISQSGRSPDLLQSIAAYRAGGAFVVAFVNDPASPLAALADEVVPLHAMPERSVAATKSYIATLAGVAALVAAWSGDRDLATALDRLPDILRDAVALDWSAALPAFGDARSLFVIGRGSGLAIAQEAALKLKETCGLHAEALSAAEVRHGPMAIVGAGFPILAFATSDVVGESVRTVAREFGERGARIVLADARGGAGAVPVIAGHPALEPIAMIQSFYPFAEALARTRGHDPDAPPHLRKVTQTL